MIKYGLCCKWYDEKINFKSTTVKKLSSFKNEEERLNYVKKIINNNIEALKESIERCVKEGIGCFRVMSGFFPCATHPEVGYQPFDDFPDVWGKLESIAKFAKDNEIVITNHPSQYIVMNSPREEVVEASIRDLELESHLMNSLYSKTIIIHVGGQYGLLKCVALVMLAKNLERLSLCARSKICIENDDKTFTAEDVYKFCSKYGYRMIFDFHHHRCNPSFKGKSEEEIADLAASTWGQGRYGVPVYHISSPKDGWNSKNPRLHADYINPNDFPSFLLDRDCVLEIEAKAKEAAIAQLMANMIDKDQLVQTK